MNQSPLREQPAPEAPAGVPRPRYQRSGGGLIGAMVVTVLAVLAFVGFRSLASDNQETPVRAVDHVAVADAARAEKQLAVLVPARLPVGWKATSATYRRGQTPSWHLGLLTDGTKYVGVEESRAGVRSMVEEHVDPDAERGEPVRLGGRQWRTWTDSGGDYALVTRVDGPQGEETVLVVGTAERSEVRDIAVGLLE